MTRVQTLREQVRVLRSLAGSFDDESIRDDLTALAEHCEDMAARIEESIRRALSRPINDRQLPEA